MGILTSIWNPTDKLLRKNQLSVKEVDPDIILSLFEHHPDAIYTLDLEGNFLSCNHRIETFIGHQPNKVKGSFIKFIREEDLEGVMEHFQKAVKGIPQQYTCEVIHKNGDFVHLDITNIPLKVDGEIIGVYGFAKDLTNLDQTEDELLKITNSLNLAQELAMLGSWDYDPKTDLVYCSQQLYQILGISKGNMAPAYHDLLDMVCFEDRIIFDYHFQRVLKSGIPFDLVYRVRKPDNSFVTVHTKAEAKKDESGNVERVIGILQDITDQVLTESKLKASEEKFETVAENIDVGIWALDISSMQIIYTSPGLERMTGFANQDFLSGEIYWNDIIHHDDLEGFLALQSNLLKGNMIHQQYRIINASGHIQWIEDKTFPSFNSDGKLIRLDGIVQDISERKLSEEKIKFFAYHDYLTELPNRRMFDEELEKLIASFPEGAGNKFALMYLDLDRFKFVNDTLGHEIGDELLRQISKRLSSLIIECDSLFRIGGDEFAIILNSLSGAKDPVSIGQKIILEIEKPFIIDDYEIHVTASIGIGIFPEDGVTIKELKMNTDAALYRAKELGKNTVQLFTKSLNIESYKLFMLETDLRKAIQREELVLYYQPRVDTLSGEIVGAEALIRWNHPKWGLVSPAEFIPLAEESGLINEIGEWVLQQVCRQLYEWKILGYNLVPISINLSPKSFLKADLVSIFKYYLTQYDISPSLLEIEITEDSIIKNEASVLNTLKLFKELGISISLDDFGTGYSSIGYLKKFNVDYIKIDRSFIKDMLENEGDFAIVSSILLLAQGFNLKVVAEGVETEEQWKALKELNCQFIQGYLFSKPLDASKFTQLLLNEIKNIEPLKKSKNQSIKNRRMYYRIVFPAPIDVPMTITEIKGEQIKIGSTFVSLLNIGEGGLSFSSKLHLPITEKMTLQFQTEVLGDEIKLEGHTVWKHEMKNDEFHYGLEFSLTDKEKEQLKNKLLSFEYQELIPS
jgi:diguanylate cyclase (GGDEF)-like protein/PAS domain S-box-containing protein